MAKSTVSNIACKVCILCGLFACFVIILNILYTIEDYISPSPDYGDDFDTTTDNEINTSENLTNNTLKIEDRVFYETYRMLSQSFTDNILTRMKNQNNSSFHCPSIPPNLKGSAFIQEPPENFTLTTMSIYHREVQFGGYNAPKTCLARHKVAIIVPYRNRWDILRRFLYHTHGFLQRQQLDYRIYVCEQAYDEIFNKGIVMNGCFKEILKLEPNTSCFIMHDVDLLLIDDRNMYSCPTYPRHLSVAIDKFDFYLPYPELVGGVLAMRREHYLLVNGYSMYYWGWGGEDDDMYKRIIKKNLNLERPPSSIARYKMLKHTHQKLNPVRMNVLRSANHRIDVDGVNNVKYTLLNITLHHLYTHFLIDVGKPLKVVSL